MAVASECTRMKRSTEWIAILCTTFVLTGHVEALEISWDDLPNPAAQHYEDPFSNLNYAQLSALSLIAQLRTQLKSPDLQKEERTTLTKKLENASKQAKESAVDPDKLLSQRQNVSNRRQRARTEGNPALDGKTAVLSGYVIPAPPDKEGRITAYLVPERGMCSHVPPPPPNKLVRLVFSEAWYPQYIYEPIQVKGRLAIEPAQRLLRVVDGLVNMQSTFVFQVSSVKTKPAKVGSGDVQQHWPIRPRS